MSEAVEWRIVQVHTLICYGLAIFTMLFGYGVLWAGAAVGGIGGGLTALNGFLLMLLGVWWGLYTWGVRRSGYIRRFCDAVPYIGGYGQRPLNEWADDLEERGAFHGDRE